MTSKTIKQIFKKKINDWISHIDDDNLRKMIKSNCIITGGAIVSLLLNEKPKDFDVYFKNKETVKAVAEYYVKKFNEKYDEGAFIIDGGGDIEKQMKVDYGDKWKSVIFSNMDENRIKIIIRSKGVAGEEEPFEDVYDTDIIMENSIENIISTADNIPAEEIEKDGKREPYRPIYLSSNAITLANKIQIVIRFHGEPEDIHKNYDFIHCTCYWTSWNNELILPAKALEAIINKQLVFCGSKYPVCSLFRMRKFIARGFTINAGQILKICFAISKLDLTDITILEDQLTGVDSAYFMQLINGLQSKIDKDPEFVIDENYVCTIIDKIFG